MGIDPLKLTGQHSHFLNLTKTTEIGVKQMHSTDLGSILSMVSILSQYYIYLSGGGSGKLLKRGGAIISFL